MVGLVTPARFERATPGLGILCSILLSYGAVAATLTRLIAGATGLLALLSATSLPALAQQAHPCASGLVISGTTLPAGTSDAFAIEGDDRNFRLANVATDVPVAILASEPLTLHAPSETADRYVRISVHAFDRAGWVQGALLANGKAFADPVAQTEACIDALLIAEANDAAFSARDEKAIVARAGLFTVVRGRVFSVGDRERRLYLNFGRKWDEDVTASVAKTGASRYRGDVDRLVTLAGTRVEIRGTVEVNGGPVIRLRDAAQIRILSDG